MAQDIALADTLENMKNIFTKRQQTDVALARQAQMCMGYPSVKDIVVVLCKGINKGGVLNQPIIKGDHDNAQQIWGNDMGSMVEKTTRK